MPPGGRPRSKVGWPRQGPGGGKRVSELCGPSRRRAYTGAPEEPEMRVVGSVSSALSLSVPPGPGRPLRHAVVCRVCEARPRLTPERGHAPSRPPPSRRSPLYPAAAAPRGPTAPRKMNQSFREVTATYRQVVVLTHAQRVTRLCVGLRVVVDGRLWARGRAAGAAGCALGAVGRGVRRRCDAAGVAGAGSSRLRLHSHPPPSPAQLPQVAAHARQLGDGPRDLEPRGRQDPRVL